MSAFPKCVVCDDIDEETSENPIFVCEQCNIGVHKLCYGVTESSDFSGFIDPWWCSPCGIRQNRAVCEFCLQGGGALKKTTCGKWVHVICALFTKGTTLTNKIRMEPVKITNVPQENRGKRCIFCLKTGVCCECAEPNCNHFLHVTCGQKYQCLKENANPKNNKIIFEAFCREHKPKGSTRRISSVFVMETLTKKDQQQQSDRNSDGSDESHGDDDVNRTCNGENIVDHSSNGSYSGHDRVGARNAVNNSDPDGKDNADNSENSKISEISHVAGPSDDSVSHINTNVTFDIIGTVDISSDGSDESHGDDDVNRSCNGENVVDHSSNVSYSEHDRVGDRNAANNSDGTENADDSEKRNLSDISHGAGLSDDSASRINSTLSDISHGLSNNSASHINSNVTSHSFYNVSSITSDARGATATNGTYWWDYMELRKREAELEVQLLSKDEKIAKLKTKKKKLKEKVRSLEAENVNFQSELQRLNSQIQQQSLASDDDSMKLDKRIASKFSEDGTELVYANGVSVSAQLMNGLQRISGGPESDKPYINAHFFVFFPEKIILDLIAEGKSREAILDGFRKTDRYGIMSDLYEHRVRMNGKGDMNTRLGLFKSTFRTKLNNWWLKHGPKNAAEPVAK